MTPKEATQKLIQAARSGNLADAKAAIAAGADLNARDDLRQMPLHWTAGNGHAELTRMLIEKGAEVNVRDPEHRTPLHWAAMMGHANIARLLIAKGAEVNVTDKWQRTPQHRATANGRTKVANLLATAERWHGYVRPLLGADKKLDATQLVDQAGQPTEALKNLLPNDLFGVLARPDFYRQGMDGLVLVFPYFPEAVQASIDLAPWRRAKLQGVNAAAGPEGGVERYVRPRRTPSSEVSR